MLQLHAVYIVCIIMMIDSLKSGVTLPNRVYLFIGMCDELCNELSDAYVTPNGTKASRLLIVWSNLVGNIEQISSGQLCF